MTITGVTATIEKEFYVDITYFDDYESDENDRIDEVSYEHIAHMISEGYIEGELNTTDHNNETHRGWWKIIEDEDE